MKVESLSGKTKRSIPKNLSKHPTTSSEVYPPHKAKFIQGNKVRINPACLSVSASHDDIAGKTLIVDRCYIANLGNMFTEVVYFLPQKGVKNPYLAEHFDRVEEL